MAGKKLKKGAAGQQLPPPPPIDDGGGDLMDDLLAQLDSRDASTPMKEEAATVLREVSIVQAQHSAGKQDSKSRHAARQARRAAARADQYAPGDPAAEARLEQEAKLEEQIVNDVCQRYALEMYEVRTIKLFPSPHLPSLTLNIYTRSTQMVTVCSAQSLTNSASLDSFHKPAPHTPQPASPLPPTCTSTKTISCHSYRLPRAKTALPP